jgi:hypothetical protein
VGSTPTSATSGPVVQRQRCPVHIRVTMVRVHPGSLHGLQVLWPHTSVVGRRAGFDSRVDLCLVGTHVPRAARVPCKHPAMGSIPIVSTGVTGGLTSAARRIGWAAGPRGRRRHRNAEIGVRFPGGPLESVGGRGQVAGLRPVLLPLNATEGSRIPVGRTTPLRCVLRQERRVRLPCLPLLPRW